MKAMFKSARSAHVSAGSICTDSRHTQQGSVPQARPLSFAGRALSAQLCGNSLQNGHVHPMNLPELQRGQLPRKRPGRRNEEEGGLYCHSITRPLVAEVRTHRKCNGAQLVQGLPTFSAIVLCRPLANIAWVLVAGKTSGGLHGAAGVGCRTLQNNRHTLQALKRLQAWATWVPFTMHAVCTPWAGKGTGDRGMRAWGLWQSMHNECVCGVCARRA